MSTKNPHPSVLSRQSSPLLLVMIYLAFISLGLPDPLLGAAWSLMKQDFGVPLGLAGILSMTITGATILSSWFSDRLIARFGTGRITAVSILFTALALLGFSVAGHILWLFLLAIPLGLGAGSIDAGLNNYVATHYKPHHMNWLHSFWGVGATAGPIIMAAVIENTGGWQGGYRLIGFIQLILFALIFLSLSLWDNRHQEAGDARLAVKQDSIFKISGVKASLAAFFLYCGIELTLGLWGASFLVQVLGYSLSGAAGTVSVYYLGITIGRILNGFLTMRFSCKSLIFFGEGLTLTGLLLLGALMWLPALQSAAMLVMPLCFLLIGLGLAPIFPCMIHETPSLFGAEVSQAIISKQVAFAYVGNTLLPMLFGGLISITTIASLPPVLLGYGIMLFYLTRRCYKKVEK